MNEKLSTILSSVESFHWWFEGRRFILKKSAEKYIPKKKTSKILDVGCGTGGNYKLLSSFGKTYGVDTLAQAIKYCIAKGIKNVEKGNATKLPFNADFFDGVFILDVMEHIRDDEKALREAARVLKDKGSIFITAPAMPSIWSAHDSKQGHFRRYTKKRFVDLAKKNNLEIVEMRHFNVFFALPIAIIRVVSRLKTFDKLGDYDSKINFDIAKNKTINSLLTKIFITEIKIGEKIPFPFGVSLFVVMKKK